MPSTAPRTVAVAATAAAAVAASGAQAAVAPAADVAEAVLVPVEDATATAPTASGAVLIPARVAAYTAAYAAAAAVVAQRRPAPRCSPNLTPEEKEVVINVYQYVTRVWPETRNSFRDCTDKISEITGLSKPEVYRFIRDRRMARPIEVPINLAVAWERMYRYYHEIENGEFRPENVRIQIVHCVIKNKLDLAKDVVLPEYCMWVLNRILSHLNNRRRHGSREEASYDPEE